MTELDAVRAYRTMAPPTLDPQASHSDATWLLSLADAAIAALEAKLAAAEAELERQKELTVWAQDEKAASEANADRLELVRELERLRVCGTCTHQDIDVDDDGRDYMPHPFVRYECDCHFPGEDYPEENDWPQGKDWGTAKNHDRCHFTPSRWTEATNEAH